MDLWLEEISEVEISEFLDEVLMSDRESRDYYNAVFEQFCDKDEGEF